MTEVTLLGPLEAPVPLPGGKPRALLARLALDAGRVVPVEALVEALWGDDPPPSAAKVLQAHVSALRKALGADAIETRPPGYALRGARTDLERFESLAARARETADARERARLLRDALALWRGEPLAEFRREPFAEAARRRLGELRLDALARRIDADLELGKHESLVAELSELVEAEPLREQPRRQLMLALYRGGRQAEALNVYRDGRRALVEELGIEPSPALQELERAILRQDASLVHPSTSPPRGRIVCSGVAPLDLLAPLGREIVVVELARDPAHLRELESSLQRVRGDRVRVAAFTSSDRDGDLARVAAEQDAELLVVREPVRAAPCDVAIVANDTRFAATAPVVVPFGGARDEWAALEFGAWLARSHGVALRLAGTEAHDGRRDASRTLAAASLALQRFAAVSAETTLVAPGADAILAQAASAIVVSAGDDATRRELAARAAVPVVLVTRGLRPGGLAPDRTLTRFSWSLADP